ncbi:YqgE/AlgH family protein [Longispora albida]|uniref:YqgE/AlgH family protein n=1 Tax=Longispora albida TaxID=203523 RepID=UPI0003697CA1|nr:YqgE/AlgH family protein [Longispora albida]
MRHEPDTTGGMAVGLLAGRLLVASPMLRDPNFERTVVLLISHDESGALGVVLNRPTEVQVSEVLPHWADLAGTPGVLFEGGPVQPEAAICLARTRPHVAAMPGFLPIHAGVGTVDLSGDPEAFGDQVLGLRVFAGYAGWGAGQAEGEIEEGSWLVYDALPGDPFMPRPDDLWSLVLRRQGGMTAALAHYPADPALN